MTGRLDTGDRRPDPGSPAPPLTVRVECYAGYRGDETPRRFWIGDRVVAVTDVQDAWLAPDHRYFKVRGDDGDIYILRHDGSADRWELTVFQRTGSSR